MFSAIKSIVCVSLCVGAVCIAGCRRKTDTTSASAGGVSGLSEAAGPIPGDIDTTHFRVNPLGTDPVALQDGRRLFDWYNCSGCHGGHAGGGMGPSLRDKDWLYGNRDDQIFDTIIHGRSQGMPAWGSKIPDTQVWELVAYIKSMGTPDEPDPPVEPADEHVDDPVNPDMSTITNKGTKTPAGGEHP